VPEKAPSGDLASGEGAPDVLDPPAEVGSLQDPPSQAGSAPDSKDAAGSQEQPPKGGAAEPGVRMDALALQRDEPITVRPPLSCDGWGGESWVQSSVRAECHDFREQQEDAQLYRTFLQL